MRDPATVDWLVSTNVTLPDEIPPGRYPTPVEIRQILDAIPGTQTAYVTSPSVWQASVTSRRDVSWASLVIDNYSGKQDQPQRFYFDAGWEEIIMLVTSHLAKQCGPLVLLDDSGAPPQIVV